MFHRSRRPFEPRPEASAPPAFDPPPEGGGEPAGVDDEPLPAADVSPTPALTSPAAEPLAPTPLRLDEEVDASSVIGPSTVVEGLVRTSEDLRVEGRVSGTLEVAGALTVERGGRVDAQVDARSVRVRGRLQGEVCCRDRFEVMRDGYVEGGFSTAVLVIEEGAMIQGRFSMRSRTIDEPTLEESEETEGL